MQALSAAAGERDVLITEELLDDFIHRVLLETAVLVHATELRWAFDRLFQEVAEIYTVCQ